MTEHICPRSTSLTQKILRTSGLYGIEADGLTVNENIWRPPGMDITPRWPAGIHFSLSLSAPEFRQWRELGGPRLVRDWWKNFASTEGVRHVVERDTLQKMAIQSEKGLEFNISNVTNCKQKACNRVNVKVSMYVLILECNLSFFHKNLKFSNTFLVLITLSDPIFFRSGDPINTTKTHS